MKLSDTIGIVILSTLYLLQGIPQGLSAGSLSVILIAKGASYTDISLISFAGVAFSLKIFWASFLDKYFMKSFGKRKTYIIPCKYFIGMLYIAYSYYFDQDIETLNVTRIAIVLLIVRTIEATADIAIDGWVLTLLSEEYVAVGPTCQSVAQSFGAFISQLLFVQLTSVKFANDYIYSQPSNEPLITYGGYLRFWGIATLIVAFLIHFFKKETNPRSREFSSVWEVFKTLKGFYHNTNLRFLCFFFLTYRLGFIFIDSAGFLELVRRGFPKETLSFIAMCVYPVQFIGPIWLLKYTLKKLEFVPVFRGMFLLILFVIGMIFTNSIYQAYKEEDFIIMLITAMLILYQVGKAMTEVPCITFCTRICDERYGGTFITGLVSIFNIDRTIIVPIGLALLDFTNFYVANIIGIVYALIYMYKFAEKASGMQAIQKEHWSLEQDSKDGIYVEMQDHKIPQGRQDV